MKNATYLIVEDNLGDLFLMKEILHDIGCLKTVIKKDGKEALDFLKDHEHIPDMIFLDINLPKFDGFEVLKYIRSRKEYDHIPVVLLTTSSSEEDLKKAYNLNASCFITKEQNFNDFNRVISESIHFWIKFSKSIKEMA